MNIVILGSGAWGTALAIAACSPNFSNREVTLWSRSAEHADAMRTNRCNTKYLAAVQLSAQLSIDHTDASQLCMRFEHADLIVIATPMSALRSYLTELAHLSIPIIWACKGFEHSQEASRQGMLGHEIQQEVAPRLLAGVLSGPSFALEVAQFEPTALVAASEHSSVRAAVIKAFHSKVLRVYESSDTTGVEVGAGMKNVLSIASGLCDGLHLGLNARAALITRGLAEMTRLGLALGGRAETFMGLSGLGDLVLTATGSLSRNRTVGLELAKGKTLGEITESIGHVAEGVYTAETALARAKHLHVDVPITQAVVNVLTGNCSPKQGVEQLMAREPTWER